MSAFRTAKLLALAAMLGCSDGQGASEGEGEGEGDEPTPTHPLCDPEGCGCCVTFRDRDDIASFLVLDDLPPLDSLIFLGPGLEDDDLALFQDEVAARQVYVENTDLVAFSGLPIQSPTGEITYVFSENLQLTSIDLSITDAFNAAFFDQPNLEALRAPDARRVEIDFDLLLTGSPRLCVLDFSSASNAELCSALASYTCDGEAVVESGCVE